MRLARTPAARIALWGLVAFVIGQTLTTAVFGVAAFFQPAIGDAFRRLAVPGQTVGSAHSIQRAEPG